MIGLLLALQVSTLSAQNPANAVYDRVILGGHVMDPASNLDAVRNIGLVGGRIAVITTRTIQGRDTINARGWSSLPASSTCTPTARHPRPIGSTRSTV